MPEIKRFEFTITCTTIIYQVVKIAVVSVFTSFLLKPMFL